MRITQFLCSFLVVFFIKTTPQIFLPSLPLCLKSTSLISNGNITPGQTASSTCSRYVLSKPHAKPFLCCCTTIRLYEGYDYSAIFS